MIMVSEITLNNYTERSNPTWLKADNYGSLLSNDHRQIGVLNRLAQLLKH